MSKQFNKGQYPKGTKLVCTRAKTGCYTKGQIYVVLDDGELESNDSSNSSTASLFEVVEETKLSYPHPPHKHAKLIKAWAVGAAIQYYGIKWHDTARPQWDITTQYRIRPHTDMAAISKCESKISNAHLAINAAQALLRELQLQLESLKSGE